MTSSRRTPRIAFIHQPWSIVRPRDVGADSVVVLTDHVARRLARRGCEVICYSRLAADVPPVEHVDGVEHRRVAGPIDRYVKFAAHKLDAWGLRNPKRPFFASALYYRQFINRVAADLARRQPAVDVVHVHNTSPFVPVLRRALPAATIALQMHCDWLVQLDRALVARRMADCDLVLGVSERLTDKIRARFPEFADRCRRVYNGADVDRFDVPDRATRGPRKTKRVLYVGRVSPEKGVHTLLEAFTIVAREADDIHLEIVGPERVVSYEMIVPFFAGDAELTRLEPFFRHGAYLQFLRALEGQLPPGRVTFANNEVAHDALPQVYGEADVFVCASIWDEPFGMMVAEAMAAGLPVVATRAGAFPELVQDGTTGVLVERANPQALADAILRLCRDDALRARMGAAARARAREHFSWDDVADSLLREYDRVRAPTAATDVAADGDADETEIPVT